MEDLGGGIMVHLLPRYQTIGKSAKVEILLPSGKRSLLSKTEYEHRKRWQHYKHPITDEVAKEMEADRKRKEKAEQKERRKWELEVEAQNRKRLEADEAQERARRLEADDSDTSIGSRLRERRGGARN